MSGNKTTDSLLTSAKGAFKHRVPGANGAKLYIEGKTDVKVKGGKASGHVEFKVTSSLLEFDEDAMDVLLDEIRECAKEQLLKYRDTLEMLNKKLANGQGNLFALMTRPVSTMKVSKPKVKEVDEAVATA